MKRNLRTVEKRTFTLKNAIPRFVSLVTRGANLTPLAELRFSDETKFSEVEINRIEFSKVNFTKASVESYLLENEYSDYEIEETDELFIVPGVDTDQFDEVTPINYTDGVNFFVGKLKQPEENNQPVNEITDSEVLDFQESPNLEENKDSSNDLAPEVVLEGDLSVEDLKSVKEQVDEEIKSEDTDSPSQEGSEGFEDEEVKEVTEQVIDTDKYSALKAEFTAKFDALRDEYIASVESLTETRNVIVKEAEPDNMTKEEIVAIFRELMAETPEVKEEVVDEKEILVQNSQVIQTEDTSEVKVDDKTDSYHQRRKANLFGLRD